MKIIRFNAVWCPACLVSKKIWKDILTDNPTIDIINYDYDMDSDMVAKYNVGDILPVVILVDDNLNEQRRLVGEKSKKEIIEFLGV